MRRGWWVDRASEGDERALIIRSFANKKPHGLGRGCTEDSKLARDRWIDRWSCLKSHHQMEYTSMGTGLMLSTVVEVAEWSLFEGGKYELLLTKQRNRGAWTLKARI